MQSFEPVGVHELLQKQNDKAVNIEERKHDDAGVPASADMKDVPDVRERKENRNFS